MGNEKVSELVDLSYYDLLAELFIYPENEAHADKVNECYNYLSTNVPEAANAMDPFMDFMKNTTLREKQELFLRSFDIQAITTLDIGYILFGEDYKRGQLLVHLNREHKEAENICHTELADHLPNVLRLISKMKNEEMRSEIATRLVVPAVVKIASEFTAEKIEKKDKIYKKHLKTVLEFSQVYRTVYASLLQTLLVSLKKEFNYEMKESDLDRITGCEEVPSSTSCSLDPREKDFKDDIETELIIEKEK